jgi:hypothetical protein
MVTSEHFLKIHYNVLLQYKSRYSKRRVHFSSAAKMVCMFLIIGMHATCSTSSFVGFEVVTAVVMKITVFRDMNPCSTFKFNRRFG